MQRRAFLKTSLAAGAFLPLASSGLFARPLRSLLSASGVPNDRILVLINLNGGNDGLNTVIPVNDDLYYQARTVLGIKKSDALSINSDFSLHPSLATVRNLFQDGRCAIVQNVGYPEPDRSHFRSTDIWHSASNAREVISTGWTGRYLETIHPEYPATLPSAPFAVQVSNSTTLLIQGSRGSMGMALDSPDRFYDLASGLTVNNDPVPNSPAGDQLKYIRQIIVEADIYSNAIDKAIKQGTNNSTYAKDTLSAQLQGVARLINGGLGTTIYVVTLPGFDTHLHQPDVHAQLLSYVSAGVQSFLDDMQTAGNHQRVVVMTYSEFGRRLAENGSAGTDHGAAAPQMVFGSPVLGGNVLGGIPNLSDLDSRGDVKMSIDFRQIYSTVLQDWLGFSNGDAKSVLGGEFARLPLFRISSVDDTANSSSTSLQLNQNLPNPASTSTSIHFILRRGAYARLSIVDQSGRIITTLVDRILDGGNHTVKVDTSQFRSGTYLYRLEALGAVVSRKMTVVH